MIQYNTAMRGRMLSEANPHLKETARAWRNRVRSIASSTAIETGESIHSIEEKINRLPSVRTRVTLA